MISFLGLGHMGVLMARRLVEAGHKVTVWNRTPRTVEGAFSAASPAEAVAEAELVITMLSDPAAVKRVLADAAPGLRPGALVVEMSTIGPDAVAELRGRLPLQVGLVDAPVLGSVQPARDGTLTVLVGGLPEDMARCREVLGVFGQVQEVGGPRAGAAMKLAVMSALVPAQVLLAETLAYGEATGVDRAALLDAASAGLGGEDLTAVFGHVGAARRTGVEKLNPASVPATNGYYSHATRAGDLLFISGQVALDADGQVVGEGDMTRQSEYGAVRGRHITGEPPASTTVEVSRLFRPGLLIEVEVIAAIPAGR
ncbi:NAD(P)-binding domain-containing protein [Streptosporangium sp. NPDC087985]|uniref:NAD(P)-binding domain-containing protein n=1 Tax=Streptosporangium sp. NPDC087985 TaxID=3366196 RepID=UPI003807AA88